MMTEQRFDVAAARNKLHIAQYEESMYGSPTAIIGNIAHAALDELDRLHTILDPLALCSGCGEWFPVAGWKTPPGVDSEGDPTCCRCSEKIRWEAEGNNPT